MGGGLLNGGIISHRKILLYFKVTLRFHYASYLDFLISHLNKLFLIIKQSLLRLIPLIIGKEG